MVPNRGDVVDDPTHILMVPAAACADPVDRRARQLSKRSAQNVFRAVRVTSFVERQRTPSVLLFTVN
jgi:hypothetical protein